MRLLLLEQGYGRVFQFDYPKFRVDKRPRVLVLGKWKHPNTQNVLLAGVNLNYLSEDEIEILRKGLGAILAQRNLKGRYRMGKKLMPGIFDTAYRTYKADEVVAVTRSTLKKWPTPKAREREAARKKWREMSPDERRAAYIERAKKAAATRKAKTSPQRREEPGYE